MSRKEKFFLAFLFMLAIIVLAIISENITDRVKKIPRPVPAEPDSYTSATVQMRDSATTPATGKAVQKAPTRAEKTAPVDRQQQRVQEIKEQLQKSGIKPYNAMYWETTN